MESGVRAELAELKRLEAKARAAATNFPAGASVFLTIMELALVGVFVFAGWSVALTLGWLTFFGVFHLVVYLRRRARPRAVWRSLMSRRGLTWALGTTLVVNAIWIPLFFFARPVALALLVAALLWSLYGNVKYRHA